MASRQPCQLARATLYGLLYLTTSAAVKNDTEELPCVIDATVAERTQAPMCAPRDESAPLCSRPHPLLDWFNGTREEALRALNAHRGHATAAWTCRSKPLANAAL